MKPKFKVGDKVKILDGSKIYCYTCGWDRGMSNYVGDIAIINSVKTFVSGNRVAYTLKEKDYIWDERVLELAESDLKDWKVIIIPDGNKTIGKLFEDGKLTTTVETKKHPKDEYSIKEAVKSITARLVEEREKAEAKFRVGDIVELVKSDTSSIPVGVRGEVVFVDEEHISVDFKIEYDPWTHNLFGIIKDKTGRRFIPKNLKLVRRP